jgi:hypothetical protein
LPIPRAVLWEARCRAVAYRRYREFAEICAEAGHDHLDRLVEAVRLSRKIGGTAPFPDLIEDEMAPPNPFMQSITNNYKNLL